MRSAIDEPVFRTSRNTTLFLTLVWRCRQTVPGRISG